DQLIQRFLDLLSHDTLPREGRAEDAGLETYILDLRNSIFIPTIGRKDKIGLSDDELRAARRHEKVDVIGHNTPIRQESPTVNAGSKSQPLGVSGLYGTQKQTIVLADKDLNIRYFERTLFDEHSNPIPLGKGDIDITFKIEKT